MEHTTQKSNYDIPVDHMFNSVYRIINYDVSETHTRIIFYTGPTECANNEPINSDIIRMTNTPIPKKVDSVTDGYMIIRSDPTQTSSKKLFDFLQRLDSHFNTPAYRNLFRLASKKKNDFSHYNYIPLVKKNNSESICYFKLKELKKIAVANIQPEEFIDLDVVNKYLRYGCMYSFSFDVKHFVAETNLAEGIRTYTPVLFIKSIMVHQESPDLGIGRRLDTLSLNDLRRAYKEYFTDVKNDLIHHQQSNVIEI